MFERPEHISIAKALRAMDAALLERTRCYFGGGTAIVLQNGEYRLSVVVDFLCADVDGYRQLRNAVDLSGAAALFNGDVRSLREFRTDQYGIRGLVSLDDRPIKFEIVREARIPLSGATSKELSVPVLSMESQFAEKLLANADRRLDRAVGSRDAVDLGYLALSHGGIPLEAVKLAEHAYGDLIARAVGQALERLANPEEAEVAAQTLQMQLGDVRKAADALRVAAEAAWPERRFDIEVQAS